MYTYAYIHKHTYTYAHIYLSINAYTYPRACKYIVHKAIAYIRSAQCKRKRQCEK